MAWKPKPQVQLEPADIRARIVHYLITRGGSHNAGEIRCYAQGLARVPFDDFWVALRALTQSGQVLFSYKTDRRDYHGFYDVARYPVFWILARAPGGDG